MLKVMKLLSQKMKNFKDELKVCYLCKQTKPDKQKFRLRNCPKLVEGSLFTIIDLLIGAKSITLYFIWRVRGLFSQNSQI